MKGDDNILLKLFNENNKKHILIVGSERRNWEGSGLDATYDVINSSAMNRIINELLKKYNIKIVSVNEDRFYNCGVDDSYIYNIKCNFENLINCVDELCYRYSDRIRIIEFK